jgi:acyl-CoA thioesterase FadM
MTMKVGPCFRFDTKYQTRYLQFFSEATTYLHKSNIHIYKSNYEEVEIGIVCLHLS